MAAASKWLQVFPARTAPRARLFCFPHAGGPAAAFFPWRALLPADVELLALELPARRARIAEAPVTSIDAIVDALIPELAARADLPFALFGHSMGATVAFELARRLRALAQPAPTRLIVSGARAPHLPREAQLHALPEPQFVAGVVALGGLTPELAREAALMELLMPSLRADFTAIERWRYADAAPLDLPISAFGGSRDPRVAPDHLDAWRAHTTSAFTARIFDGGHFYVDAHRAALLDDVSLLLRG